MIMIYRIKVMITSSNSYKGSNFNEKLTDIKVFEIFTKPTKKKDLKAMGM
jgi:hypothetical protein